MFSCFRSFSKSLSPAGNRQGTRRLRGLCSQAPAVIFSLYLSVTCHCITHHPKTRALKETKSLWGHLTVSVGEESRHHSGGSSAFGPRRLPLGCSLGLSSSLTWLWQDSAPPWRETFLGFLSLGPPHKVAHVMATGFIRQDK